MPNFCNNTLDFKTKKEKDWLLELLHECDVCVEFVKKDGSMRKMLCTLSKNKIPDEKIPKNSGKSQSDEAVAVFDLEKQEWRSFRFNSVKKIDFSLEKK